MKRIVRKLILVLGNIILGIIKSARTTNPCVKVLIYHDIPPDYVEKFRIHILTLKNTYDFITPETFHKYLNGEHNLERDSLLITFDDGFLSSYQSAIDILEPLGVYGLFFICSGFIDAGEKGEWKSYTSEFICDGEIAEAEVEEWQKPMSWNQIRELNDSGHMIGGHTRNHIRLSTLEDRKMILAELSDDKERLEEEVGDKITTIAYPFGGVASISSKALNAINSCYEYCYSGVRGVNRAGDNKLTINRDVVGYYLDLPFVEFIAKGGYDWYYINDRKQLKGMAES